MSEVDLEGNGKGWLWGSLPPLQVTRFRSKVLVHLLSSFMCKQVVEYWNLHINIPSSDEHVLMPDCYTWMK